MSEKNQDDYASLEMLKIQQIKSSKLRKKFKVFFICLFFIVIFSLYFIGTYMLQLKTYSNISAVVDSLKLIYQKNYCPETIYALIRESQIKNTTNIFGDDDSELITR
jgi:hypothetical protein